MSDNITPKGVFTIRIERPWIDFLAEILTPRAFVLYMLLEGYRDKDTGECFPGMDRLGKTMGCSYRAVQQAITELADRGVIERVRRANRQTNLYILHRDPTKVHGRKSDRKKIAGRDRKKSAGEHIPVLTDSSSSITHMKGGEEAPSMQRRPIAGKEGKSPLPERDVGNGHASSPPLENVFSGLVAKWKP